MDVSSKTRIGFQFKDHKSKGPMLVWYVHMVFSLIYALVSKDAMNI
jgi:hypothetical protein